MGSIEERLQALNRTIRQMEVELSILRTSVHSQPQVYTGVGSNIDISSHNVVPGSNLDIPTIKPDKNIRTYRRYSPLSISSYDHDDDGLFDTESKRKDTEPVPSPLTIRETQILSGVASGNTNKQIALILEVSEQTIKNHVSNILHKLGANDRAHAVYLAIRHGWLLLQTKHQEVIAVS